MSPIGVGTPRRHAGARPPRASGGDPRRARLGQGALVGGLLVGVAEVFAGDYLAEYTDTLGNGYSLVVPYVVMLIVLVVRPYGLFGTPEIRRV